jgi:hypothetical protein
MILLPDSNRLKLSGSFDKLQAFLTILSGMKTLLTIIFSMPILSVASAQDSLQIKRNEIVSKLEHTFSGNWSYQLIDPSVTIKWDTVFKLPPNLLRINIYLKNKNEPNIITTYFFESQEADTIIKRILIKNIRKGLNDSSDFEFSFPLVNMNQTFLAISFPASNENIDELQLRLRSGLGLEEAKIKLEDIKEEEESIPPPPPPPPKRMKRTKN